MFYDERIESVKGKTAKNCIIISVILALLMGAIRVCNVLRNHYTLRHLWFISIEFTLVLLGSVFLLVGQFAKGKIRTNAAFLSKLSFITKSFLF